MSEQVECKGVCGRTLPHTKEFFYAPTKYNQGEHICKECNKAASGAQRGLTKAAERRAYNLGYNACRRAMQKRIDAIGALGA